MTKQNLSEVKTAPAPWFKVEDGFYDATLVDVTTTNKGGQFRYRYTFALLNADGGPLLEKSVDAGGRKTKKENLKQVTLIRTTSPSMQEGSRRRKILEALPRGQDMFGIVPLESLPLEDILNSPVIVLVQNQPNSSGVVYSNITEVFAPDMRKTLTKTNAA